MVLLKEHRGRLTADFRRFYGCNLSDVLAGSVAPLREVCHWAAWLPKDSAVERALNPAPDHDFPLEMLRKIEHHTRWLAWSKTKAAQHNRDIPEPFEFPWEEPRRKVWQHDVMEWDEAAEKLGGDPRMAALMAKL